MLCKCPQGPDVTCIHVQFAYMALVGTFPFNSFLAGIFSSLGFFALTGAW